MTGGTITITSRIHDHYLVLCVQDEGHGQAPCLEQIESGIGIGMKNTQERLESFYGKQHSLEVSDVQPHGLSVQIRIPLTGANQT